MQATTIDEVIDYMTEIIQWSKENRNRAGYFAALYRQVTMKVRDEIANGAFENNDRMEHLDVTFANRYLADYTKWRNGDLHSASWGIAFKAVSWWRPTVIQHLMVGINAHINLDLGVAAAEVAPGDQFASLHNDFNKINEVLASLVNGVKEEMAQIWPMARLINAVSGGAEDAIINFSMQLARDGAWKFGSQLAPLNATERAAHIKRRDDEMSLLGDLTVLPPPLTSAVLLAVRLGEQHSIPKVIDILS